MSEKQIVVQWDVARSSQNTLQGMGRFHQAEIIRDALCAGFRGWLDSGKPTWKEKVTVDLIVRKATRMDECNLWGASKHALDGALVGRKEGRVFLPSALPDDNPDWLRIGSVKQEISPQYRGREQIVFVVRPMEQAKDDVAL